MDLLAGGPDEPDAFVVVDADSVADPGLLTALAARAEAGTDVVQAEYLALTEDESPASMLRAAALLLFHRVRFSGRAALGMPCNLVGNGMLFSRRVLEEHPWGAFSSAEDLEYSIDLRLAGFGPVYAAEGSVRGPMPSGGRAARTQRMRWEGGRFHVVRTRLPKLVEEILRQRRWGLLDAAVDLAVPPLGILMAGALAGTAASASLVAGGLVPAWVLAPWLVGSLSVPAFVLVGLWSGKAPPAMYRSLALAPWFLASALAIRLRLVRGLRATTWERTERPSDRGPDRGPGGGSDGGSDRGGLGSGSAPARPGAVDLLGWPSGREGRPHVGGVPVDLIGAGEALERTMSAVAERRFMQVCTVNLDFLVNARRDPRVRTILRSSELNVADGAPVVWLARLLGYPAPGRVAGSDFVPLLMESAARNRARVFFLGGENGAGAAAARRLRERLPGLSVTVHEPPRRALEDMDHDDILCRIEEAQADILLVAFGHPKQDRWIALNRDRIPASVAIGVGCTFDLIAGHRTRAPSWMRERGLEWFYRFLREPRRLGGRYALDAWWLLTTLVPLSLHERAFAGRRD